MKGLVVKKIADFFYVECNDEIYEAKPRGIFKKNNQSILVGDEVTITILDKSNKDAVIDEVSVRKNMLIRPNVANITKLILVFSVIEPKLNLFLIDSFLVMAKKNNIDAIICFSKIDLDLEQSYLSAVKLYEDIGYKTVQTSSFNLIGIDEIKKMINDDITVIAGPSGAGKSSLINELSEEFAQNTSNISIKLQKGKNTTTYSTLLKLSDKTYIADTPGFTSLKVMDIEKEELKDYFIEFDDYSENCKFGNKCLHENEPDCGVKKAVEDKKIYKSRHDSYLRILDEIKKFQKRGKY